jgi:hypothetical protein
MSITLNLRYSKRDQYGSEIFIATPKYPEEKNAYDVLLTIKSKLNSLNLDTFLPVYRNEELQYATVRFKVYKGMKLEERNIYTVEFVVKKSSRGDKEYINCHVNTIKMFAKAKPIDYGITLDLF